MVSLYFAFTLTLFQTQLNQNHQILMDWTFLKWIQIWIKMINASVNAPTGVEVLNVLNWIKSVVLIM